MSDSIFNGSNSLFINFLISDFFELFFAILPDGGD